MCDFLPTFCSLPQGRSFHRSTLSDYFTLLDFHGWLNPFLLSINLYWAFSSQLSFQLALCPDNPAGARDISSSFAPATPLCLQISPKLPSPSQAATKILARAKSLPPRPCKKVSFGTGPGDTISEGPPPQPFSQGCPPFPLSSPSKNSGP